MATIGAKYLTLADKFKRTENGKTAAEIIEMMSETNELLQDANALQCNDGTNHITTVRTGLPSAVFRTLYGFVPSSKSTTEQVKDVTGMLETYSIVDVDLVEKCENPKLFRLSESSAFIEAMNQKLQETIFYGSIKENAAAFDGLTVRYSKKSTDTKKIGSNIIDAGGTGDDNTSIWFITWGDLHTSLLYPQGSQAGVQHKDDGVLTETSTSGGKRKVYQDHFKMDVGLSVRDWRSTCRIANISISNLADSDAVDIEELLNEAYYKIRRYAKAGGRTCIYCNSTVLMYFEAQLKSKTNVNFTFKEYLDESILHYKNIPIRECEQITNEETLVS
ncbi:MAG: hypothetical protein LUG16_01125 [Candidatus Gastranaerophilales bacterium]|nr:hypothetical protein [Candidatus Gastranaerophilales bacterium]